MSDDFLTDFFRPAKYVSLGPEPLWAYYHAREMDARNIRAVILGLQVGEGREKLRRELRQPYV
jgi:vacuolar-type H+-ATPase subunit C/Vma6